MRMSQREVDNKSSSKAIRKKDERSGKYEGERQNFKVQFCIRPKKVNQGTRSRSRSHKSEQLSTKSNELPDLTKKIAT